MRKIVPLLVLCSMALLVAPATAGEIASNVVDHILTVNGSGSDDAITIRCEDGEVTVNRDQPSGGPEDCSRLQRILVFGEGGDDRVSLSSVTAAVFGRLKRVVVSGGPGDDTLIGSALGDELQGGGGVDTLRGGAGPDDLYPGLGPGEVIGGKGHDTALVRGNGDWVVNDGRIVRLTPSSLEITMSSVEAVEVTGGRGDNVISAASFSGILRLYGLRGDDRMQSGPRHDTLDGGGGNDFLDSGAGNDLLLGRAGDDVLRGGEGNDQLRGGPGNDVCTGGPGADSELSC